MNYLILTLRIIHIGAGVFWVGGVLMMTFFIAPTVRAMGESGPKFVAHLVNNLKFTTRMSIAAGLTVLAGGYLYWIDSQGLTLTAWMNSGAGIGFGIGSGFGLIGFLFGILIGQTTKALVRLGSQLQGKPSAEQLAQLQSLQKKQMTYSSIATASLLLSVLFMAIARYIVL